MRTASLDLELLEPESYPQWKNPKLEKLSDNAWSIYQNTGGGQVVFCDRVFSSDKQFNMHDKIKKSLIEKGFKDNEIIVVNGFTKGGRNKSDTAVEKETSQAVEDFNKGIYKVIIGTTACIGTGLNLQENSAALHHLDIPFRPADFIQRNGRIDRQGNKQESVELHTYLATGTIDNYSVALVQSKSNWIDQLLNTKSHVFINPEDDNFVDADELLLSLTEEWGDKNKAQERREELQRTKEEKIIESKNQQRKQQLSSLSMMKSLIKQYENGSIEYQKRLRKIQLLEKSLLENPTFTNHSIIDNDKDFLYSKNLDMVIQKGDILLYDNEKLLVDNLNFKKQKIICEKLDNPDKIERDKRYYCPTRELELLKLEQTKIQGYFPQASASQINLLKMIDSDEFYRESQEIKEKYYDYHITASLNNNNKPLYFTKTEDNKLLIGIYQYSYQKTEINRLNPFKEEDIKTIKKLIQNGIDFDATFNKDTCINQVIKNFNHINLPIQKKLIDEYKKEKGIVFDSSNSQIIQDKSLEITPSKQSYIAQAHDLFQLSIENNSAKWNTQWSSGRLTPSYNPISGEQYDGMNLLNCILYQNAYRVSDTRYITDKQIIDLGLSLTQEAKPLLIAKREHGKIEFDIVYNANHIEGLPEDIKIDFQQEYECEESLEADTPEEQISNLLISFMEATKNTRAYYPNVNEAFTQEDYNKAALSNGEKILSGVIKKLQEKTRVLYPKEQQEEDLLTKEKIFLSKYSLTMDNFKENIIEISKHLKYKDNPIKAAQLLIKHMQPLKQELNEYLQTQGCVDKESTEKTFKSWISQTNSLDDIAKLKELAKKEEQIIYRGL